MPVLIAEYAALLALQMTNDINKRAFGCGPRETFTIPFKNIDNNVLQTS